MEKFITVTTTEGYKRMINTKAILEVVENKGKSALVLVGEGRGRAFFREYILNVKEPFAKIQELLK